MTKLPYVYLAGPYTHPDPVENTHRIVKLAVRLYGDNICLPYIPHLTLMWHLIEPHSIDFWYSIDLQYLERCDAVLRLPGDSSGADKEVVHAASVGMPVFHYSTEWVEFERFCARWDPR